MESFPDIVISDLSMPGPDGFDVHDWLIDQHFDGHFVLCSGDAGLLEESFLRIKEIDILIKPIVPTPFLEKLKSYV